MRRIIGAIASACVLLAAASAFGQTPPPAVRLLITVVDPSNGVLPGAVITLAGLDEATKAVSGAPTRATDKGLATIEGIPLGRYAITAEFPGPGFEKTTLKDVRVRAGDNKHVIVLPLKKMEDSVTVAQDRQAQAADRATTFGTALTREQIQALSDDPDEMRRQLQEMGGLDAVIRVDSFEGQDLPPKAQIKSIHITRDQFAAESHSAGGTFVDIITQPGMGPLRTSVRTNFADSALDGRNPLVQRRGPSQSRGYGGSIGGSLIREKATFSISINGSNNYSTPVLYAATSPAGSPIAENLTRQPFESINMSGLLDYAITKDQTIRMGFGRGRSSQSNLGVGDFSFPERAYESESDNWSFRIQEAGPLGRRFFTNTRFSINASNSTSRSVSDALTIVVNDASTRGGSQRKGGTHSKNFSLASDLDYVRGKHSWRTGIEIIGSRYRSDAVTNFTGTYTFASIEDFDAGRPRSFTRRVGDPTIEYWNVQAGVYLQDDIRLRKNLTFSTGLRYEAQTHLRDYANFGPRAGLTWSPFKSGRTSVRASAGIFYDWFSTGTYQQSLQFDGFHQQEVNVVDPGFPEPGALGSAPPTNRYLLDDDLRMAMNKRISLGVSQQVNKRMGVSATYSDIRGSGLLVGQNLNAPIDGDRPDPVFANVVRTVSDARSRTRSLSVSMNLNLAAMSSGPAAPPLPGAGGATTFFDWKRGMYLFGSYGLRKAENNTDGAFTIPTSTDLAAEWGPASGDVRNNGSISISSSAFRNVSVNIGLNFSSAPPITIRTGRDENGDLVFNDRPAGVGRNSERTVGNFSSYGSFNYSLGFGKRTVAMPPGVMIMEQMGGPVSVSMMNRPATPRYRLSIGVSVENLTNRAQYGGFSGVMTSPFFLKPTSAYGVRTVRLNMGLSF